MNAVLKLVDYAKKTGLIEEEEQIWAVNTLLDALGLDALPELPVAENATLPEILDTLLDDAYARGVLKENTTTYRDLFDTELMGRLTPRPAEVRRKFEALYWESPKAATDVIKHTVKHHTNTCFVKCCAHVGKVLIRSQAHIDFLIITRIVTMPIRLKYRREVHGIAAKSRQMGYPVNDLEDSMFKYTVILAWCTAKPNGINLVENALVCPTD